MGSLAGGDAHCVRDSVYSRFWIPMNFEMAFDKNTQDFCAVTDFNESRSRVKKSKINQSPEHIQHIAIVQYNVLNYKINSKVISAFKDVEMHPALLGMLVSLKTLKMNNKSRVFAREAPA